MTPAPDTASLREKLALAIRDAVGHFRMSHSMAGLGADAALALIQPVEEPPASVGRMDAWQPVETAPKDGTWILLIGGAPGYGHDGDVIPMCVGQFEFDSLMTPEGEDGDWRFAHYDGGYYGIWDYPTHWMPLPSPPSPEQL